MKELRLGCAEGHGHVARKVGELGFLPLSVSGASPVWNNCVHS
jgi:hypothetical protein